MKSFSRRIGRRLTKSRKSDLNDYLPGIALKVDDNRPIALSDIYAHDFAAYELEIGFGTGEHFVARAKDNPDIGYIGCEPYLNGVAKAVSLIRENNIDNIRVYADDATHVIKALPDQAIDRIMILFPDPWPKKRHHVRRLINLSFLETLVRITKPGGLLVIATDHADYAKWIEEKIESHKKFRRINTNTKRFPDNWHKSKYHLKAENQALEPFYFEFALI